MNKTNSTVASFRTMITAALIFGTLPLQASAQSSEAPNMQGLATMVDPGGLPNITGAPGARPQIQQIERAQQVKQAAPQASRSTKPNGDKDKFQVYVETVTGGPATVFGRNLFADVPSTFAPIDAAQVNSEYIIGTGDELQIRGWGMINIDVTATVDRNGEINIPRVGSIKVAGVKYRDLQGYIKQAVGKIFSNFELTASIAQTRAVQIYVAGHAARPGTYTLSSMSTLLNALFTSGGPSDSGSMRNIQLKRGTRTVTNFDLYDVLVNGDKSRDVSLQDGDVIFIPEVGPLVALTGNVKTPAIFELKGPSTLADLVTWAGGVDSSSENREIIVEKTVNNRYETIAEVRADKGAAQARLAQIPVNPTDVIRVFAPSAVGLPAQIQREYVRVSGEVKQSGIFEIQKGETLRSLMARLGGTNEAGYIYATQLKRESTRRAQQEKLDEVAARFERDIESSASARLMATTDKDILAAQAAELERQRVLAQKLRGLKAEGRIVLELDDAAAQLKDLPELPLQDGDNVFIPRRPGTIEVLGAVFQSNSFIHKPGRTVKDYVEMAGGATESADSSHTYIIRADGTTLSRSSRWIGGVNGTTLNPGDTVVIPEQVNRGNLRQSIKEWTTIFYQFGLGAAGLKVLRD